MLFMLHYAISDLQAVLLYPFHHGLPACVLFISPTCNKYTQADSKVLLDELHKLLIEHNLHNIIGPPLTTSSDGDARRRAIQVAGTFCQLRAFRHSVYCIFIH